MNTKMSEKHLSLKFEGVPFKVAAPLLLVLLISSSLLAQTDVKRPRILGISHVAFFVSDLNKTLAFYKDFLGFEEPFALKRQDGTDWIAYIKVNDYQYIELFAGNSRNHGQLAHIALYTDNAARLRDYLVSQGITIVEQLHKAQTGNDFFSVIDPDGHRVEIFQYQPDSWMARSKGKFMPAARVSDHILHAGITVASSQPALKFYQDVLGLQVANQGSDDETQTHWIDMRVPESNDYIQLVLSRGQPSQGKQEIQNDMSLEASNIQTAVTALQARSGSASYSYPVNARTESNHASFADLFDPDGIRIRVAEPIPSGRVSLPRSSQKP